MKWQIPYDGRTWEFDSLRLTASEARLQKRLTDGMTPTTADDARNELDPDGWVAALAIARKRAGLPVDIATAIDDDRLSLGEIEEATTAFYAAQRSARDEAADEPEPAATEAAPAA